MTSPTIVERRADDGRLLATVSLDQNNGLEGPFVAYDDNGQRQLHMICHAGQPDGPATFYRNGRPEAQLGFAAGRLNGEMRSFDAAGRVVAIVRYVAGRRHGLMECRSPDGSVVLTADYRNDCLNGAWTEFRPDGSIRRRALYKGDLLDGETIEYDADSQPTERTVYTAGRIIEGPQKVMAPVAPKAKPSWQQRLGL
jgi:hypothetical protein